MNATEMKIEWLEVAKIIVRDHEQARRMNDGRPSCHECQAPTTWMSQAYRIAKLCESCYAEPEIMKRAFRYKLIPKKKEITTCPKN